MSIIKQAALAAIPTWKKQALGQRWSKWTPNVQETFLRIYRSKRGIQRASVPTRTYGTLKQYLMEASDGTLMLNAHGCDMLDYLREIGKVRPTKECN